MIDLINLPSVDLLPHGKICIRGSSARQKQAERLSNESVPAITQPRELTGMSGLLSTLPKHDKNHTMHYLLIDTWPPHHNLALLTGTHVWTQVASLQWEKWNGTQFEMDTDQTHISEETLPSRGKPEWSWIREGIVVVLENHTTLTMD